jgi:hypothetical protein
MSPPWHVSDGRLARDHVLDFLCDGRGEQVERQAFTSNYQPFRVLNSKQRLNAPDSREDFASFRVERHSRTRIRLRSRIN